MTEIQASVARRSSNRVTRNGNSYLEKKKVYLCLFSVATDNIYIRSIFALLSATVATDPLQPKTAGEIRQGRRPVSKHMRDPNLVDQHI